MSEAISTKANSNKAIKLEGVGVQYRIPTDPIKTFKEYTIRVLQGRLQHRSFWALKNININLDKGEIFGILGRNGAGKSTLLKVVSRVLIPTEGRVWIKGNISPLLQLGAGFHPELTGIENIYLNATILGHKQKEIEQKIEDIIDFSEIGDFINVPLRTYSSGMRARLGFAVATAWKPDILLLDEVLAVGDVAFKEKCIDRMSMFRDQGSTVLVVSHSIDNIKETCHRAMWLDEGQIRMTGPAEDICLAYKEEMKIKSRRQMHVQR
jgi:ABC-type polysaccharide/polyol phosphate transport system ATPase subunit